VDPGGSEISPLLTRRLLVCTGGKSYPKTGSDGSAWVILHGLGHTIVPPVPALTPFVLGACFHRELAGVSLPARLTLRVDGRVEAEATGPLLWTHFGVSGPAALDLSGHWARSRRDRPRCRLEVLASFLPEESAESLEARWVQLAASQAARTVRGFLDALPHRLADALARDAGADPHRPLAQTPREIRRAVCRRVCALPLPAVDVRGFGQAEVTSGGIPLEETDGGLESRILPGVHFAGEVLHVDGRLGGFNFQWAWSSATVAAEAAIDRLCADRKRSGAARGATEGGK
jgi:predicted Rossmann fold flavoprotein